MEAPAPSLLFNSAIYSAICYNRRVDHQVVDAAMDAFFRERRAAWARLDLVLRSAGIDLALLLELDIAQRKSAAHLRVDMRAVFERAAMRQAVDAESVAVVREAVAADARENPAA